MRLENIVFDNIRIYGYGEGKNHGELIRLKPLVNQYMRTKEPGYINNITFKNISVKGKEGSYKIQIMGADNQHTVSNVIFDGVSVLNQKVTKEYGSLEMGDFVSNVEFKW